MWPDGFPTADYVRQARRRAGASQRAFAEKAGVGMATVGRIEAGHTDPSVGTLDRLLACAGLGLVVIDDQARFIPPLAEWGDDCRDGAGRHYPAHLDLVVEPMAGEWWADNYGLIRPPETFYRDRRRRDLRRTIAHAQVRYQGPPPRWPTALLRAAGLPGPRGLCESGPSAWSPRECQEGDGV